MAVRKAKAYVSQAKTVRIEATSRCAIKTKHDYYYTIEAHEVREIPDSDTVNLDKEWELLFDSVNNICDTQAADILKNLNDK